MEFSDLLVILLITAGATKAAAFFVAQARDMSRPEKLTVVTRALAIQAVVLGIFALRGENILDFFHVSVAALEVAGGLVLLLFALQLVLGEDHGDEHGAPGGVSHGAGILRSGAVQLDDAILKVVQLKPIAGAAEGVGQDDVGASFDVGAMHILHAFGMGDVPLLRAAARDQPARKEFGAHGAVEEQDGFFFEQIE